MKKNFILKAFLLLLCLCLTCGAAAALTACSGGDKPSDGTSGVSGTSSDGGTTADGAGDSTTAGELPGTDTEAPGGDTTSSGGADTTDEPETTNTPETTDAPATEPETDAETDAPGEIVYNTGDYGINDAGKIINPLTGLAGTEDMLTKRPAAIMINNLKISCPQIGISDADVIYECLAEGGITRLMMVVTDYEKLGAIGSVRSSREYYLDYAQNHDAIYVHAGGSTQAYKEIQQRGINNLDGVNMYAMMNNGYFYRDANRKATMGAEHSLCTTGEGLVKAIAYKKYRTTLTEGIKSPFRFYNYSDPAVTPDGDSATHVIIPLSKYTYPQYIYNKATGTYLRYQFNGAEHIDGTTGKQLEFTNVLILAVPHYSTGDSYNHIDIDTSGTGEGYYITMGKCVKIKWTKSNEDVPMVLTLENGEQLYMNCGKTFINIVSPAVFDGVKLNGQN